MQAKANQEDVEFLMTTSEAAALLRMHPFSLHRLRSKGDREIPWTRVRGRIFYLRSDLLAVIESGKFGKAAVPAKPFGARGAVIRNGRPRQSPGRPRGTTRRIP
jgi:hypothetical protein